MRFKIVELVEQEVQVQVLLHNHQVDLEVMVLPVLFLWLTLNKS